MSPAQHVENRRNRTLDFPGGNGERADKPAVRFSALNDGFARFATAASSTTGEKRSFAAVVFLTRHMRKRRLSVVRDFGTDGCLS